MKGVYSEFVRPVLVVFGALTLISVASSELDAAIFRWAGYGADSTDTEARRSGLALHTDAETVCQYLASAWGGITPRLDAAGYHMCRKLAESLPIAEEDA